MPFLGGKTLDKLLIPLAFDEALSIIEQTAKGLVHAHAQGIIHCDIKPANLMLTKGHIKILDFGLSRLQDEDADGERVGTLEYMSPEAVRGQKLTAPSDVWSLGVVFYELLTGQSPFRAAGTAATLRNIAELGPPAVSCVRPGLPEGIDVIFEKLLSKHRETRYSSADELLLDLVALQEGKILARVPSKPVDPSSSLTVVSAKLPQKPELLLGRDDELALLSLYLQDPECRLLTLQGMGGIGKTQLSLWAAHEQAHFKYIHFVELAPVAESSFVAALAQGLDVAGDATLDAVQRTIGKRKQLLVLDNFEHLTSRAFMVEKLLESCPNLTVFITTRERLALADEWVVPLQGLSVPSALPLPGEARNYAALVLFEHLARRHDKSFEITASLGSAFFICSRLHGHPLGMLLAAAWLDRFSTEELAERLEQSFMLLENGAGRHHSLKAIFDQSYSLLTPEQQHVLTCLGIFEGGFDLGAARVIMGASLQMLDALLDRSLLELSLDGRYHQHPVLHSFCKEKLAELDLAELDNERIKRYEYYYLEQLKTLRVMLRGSEQSKAFERLERDFANLRCVVEGQINKGLSADVAESFRAFYTHKGRYIEGWELFSRASGEYAQVCAAWFALLLGKLEEAKKLTENNLGAEAQTWLIALNTKAGILVRCNELGKAKTLSLEALRVAIESEDFSQTAAFASNIAMIEKSLGHTQSAIDYYQQSLTLSERTKNHAQTLTNFNNLADVYLSQQDIQKAKPLLEKALILSETSKLTRMKPFLLANFGLCLYAQGDYAHAEGAYLEAYQLSLERGDEIEAVSAKIYLGQALAAQGKIEKATTTLREALVTTQSLLYTPGMLSAVVRFAELVFLHNKAYAKELAALVSTHPHTETGDRNLAQNLAQGTTTSLTLETAVNQLLDMSLITTKDFSRDLVKINDAIL
jgi:tetratricopeptide (TPR) repeat protein